MHVFRKFIQAFDTLLHGVVKKNFAKFWQKFKNFSTEVYMKRKKQWNYWLTKMSLEVSILNSEKRQPKNLLGLFCGLWPPLPRQTRASTKLTSKPPATSTFTTSPKKKTVFGDNLLLQRSLKKDLCRRPVKILMDSGWERRTWQKVPKSLWLLRAPHPFGFRPVWHSC